ncbi:Uncharacterised protein [uncultured archaeon]|nr:Uncharacterised protein [uncultured archaeon]
MKSQMALWILSKTSMIFFIIALFAIVVAGTSLWEKSFCSSQADVLASQITDVMNQIINSPLEDEKRIFTLEPALSVGGSSLQKYTIDVNFIPDLLTYPIGGQQFPGNPQYVNYNGRINVKVSTEGGCSASRTISFTNFVTLPQTFDTADDDPTYINGTGYYTVDNLLYDTSKMTSTLSRYLKKIRIFPSFRELNIHPSTYLIFIKCTNKASPLFPLGSKFFIMDNCWKDVQSCLKLNDISNDPYAYVPGFPSTTINDICQQNPGATEPE